MTKNDFGMSFTDANGTFIRLEEINRMIALSIITVDEDTGSFKLMLFFEFQ